MSSPAASPPSRLVSDELRALAEPLIPRRPAIHGAGATDLGIGTCSKRRLRVVHRHQLGQAAERAGLRVGLDLLAPDARGAEAGVFDRLRQVVLDRLGEDGRLDWSRASLDSVSVRAKRGVR